MANEFELGGVVPWGREADEYEAFFALDDVAPSARVLDCAGGPASFTAEWRARGRRVTAADPLYRFSSDAIRARFEAACGPMRLGMERAHAEFVWDFYGSEDGVVERRVRSLERFAADRNSHPGHYVAAALPLLPFARGTFDLVLCSHLLFLYAADLSRELHVAALREMLRVGREVRVFPLLDLDGAPSAHLEPALAALGGEARAELVSVPYEFRRGANRLLRLTSARRAPG
jgi:SAM-dependent methyltransferase